MSNSSITINHKPSLIREMNNIFSGTACFSPSVPPMIRQAWAEHGGKVAMTKDERRFSDWFFCDGMSDPWLRDLSSKMIAVFHAKWILDAVREQFPISLAKYVLDDNFEFLNEGTWDDLSSIESPSSTYSELGSESSSIADEQKCENLISSDVRSIGSEYENERIPMTHFEQDQCLPTEARVDTQMQSVCTRRYSSPLRTKSETLKISFTGSGKDYFSHPVLGLSKLPIYTNELKSFSNSRTSVTLTSGPGKKSVEFEIELIPSHRMGPSSSVANQPKWEYSSVPQDLWGSLTPIEDSSGLCLPISVKDTITALSVIPIADITIFIPGETHLDKEFIYNGTDRRKTV